MHDLVGNVAEYVFDGPKVTEVKKDQRAEVSITGVDATVSETGNKFYVIGGSALSPPEVSFDKPLPVATVFSKNGFCDVGLRLAYTAPIDTVVSVMDDAFPADKRPAYLPIAKTAK
jgi:hypothetical protein